MNIFKKINKFLIAKFAIFSVALLSFSSITIAGEPLPWQKGLQPAASPVMEKIDSFHDMLLFVITGITIFVFLLLAFVLIRFNAKANPVPSSTTHHHFLEGVWTFVPVVILFLIAIPSLKMLFYMDRTIDADMTLKVTGYQWYWGYEYPDHDGINFFSYMIPDEEIDPSKGEKRLLSTDTKVVLPIDTDIQILITAADVLHAWAIPAFGIKRDAVPGRTNEAWVRITKPGTYYGQCSELCGKDHAFMPIEIKAVTKEEFDAWVKQAKTEYSMNGLNNNETSFRLAKVEE
jgi:cytochrome c oxidase subunit 2